MTSTGSGCFRAGSELGVTGAGYGGPGGLAGLGTLAGGAVRDDAVGGLVRGHRSRFAMRSPTRRALAMAVRDGLTAPMLGKKLVFRDRRWCSCMPKPGQHALQFVPQVVQSGDVVLLVEGQVDAAVPVQGDAVVGAGRSSPHSQKSTAW